MIQYKCYHCKSPIESPDETAGEWRKCPSCGSSTQVPGPPGKTAASGSQYTILLASEVLLFMLGLFLLVYGLSLLSPPKEIGLAGMDKATARIIARAEAGSRKARAFSMTGLAILSMALAVIVEGLRSIAENTRLIARNMWRPEPKAEDPTTPE